MIQTSVSAPFAFAVLAFCAAALYFAAKDRALPSCLKAVKCAALILLGLFAAVSPALRLARKTPPHIAVLADAAASMKNADRQPRAQTWLKTNLPELKKYGQVSAWTYDTATSELTSAESYRAGGGFSDLRQALSTVFGGARPERAIVLTDGVSAARQSDTAWLSALPAPVDFVDFSAEKKSAGINFDDLRGADFAFRHVAYPLSYRLTATGLRGKNITLKATANGVVLASATIVCAADTQTAEGTFTFTPQAAGPLRVKVTAQAGKISAETEYALTVIHEKRRILYLCGTPSAEYASLRDFLKGNPANELVTFVILRSFDSANTVAENELSLIPFPAEQLFRKDLKLFDIVILENFSYDDAGGDRSYETMVTSFTAAGGGLLYMGTEKAYQRDAPYIPFAPNAAYSQRKGRIQPYRHPVAELYGDDSSRRWASLPPQEFMEFSALKKGAVPVLGIKNGSGVFPLAAAFPFGKGRVLALGAVSSWKWRLGAAASPDAAGLYGLFWNRALDYLSGDIDMSPLTLSVAENYAGCAKLRLLAVDETRRPLEDPNAKITARVTGPNGFSKEADFFMRSAGVFIAEVSGLPAGALKAEVSAESGGRLIGRAAVSFNGDGASDTSGFVRLLAQKSGGNYYTPESFSASAWAAPAARQEETRLPLPQWALNALALFVLAAFCAEWVWRRRHGLF